MLSCDLVLTKGVCMKRILLMVITFVLAGAGVSQAAGYGTGLIVPPLAELKRQFDEQAKAAASLLESEGKRIEEYRRLFGALPQDNIRRRLPSAAASEFDWTELGVVSGVQDQGQCSSCYIFAPVAAFEASYHIRNGVGIGASEQAFLDVAKTGCDPGWVAEPLTWLVTRGTAKRSEYPYTASKGSYRPEVPPVYRGAIWGIVSNGTTEFITPTQQNIKEALLRHGPLVTGIYASDAFITSKDKPTDWVFSERKQFDGTNHAVTIVGWSNKKSAWKIKNSWGKEWGHNGFAWVQYGSNNIGTLAAWVEAPINLLDKLPKPADVRQAFEDELGKFHVRLEQGTATISDNQAVLKGVVSIGHTGARTRLTLNGELKLQKGGGGAVQARVAGERSAAAGNARRVGMETELVGGRPAVPWTSASGSGSAELQIGAIRFTYRKSSLELTARGDGNLSFGLRNTPDLGCSSTIGGNGSLLGVTEANLAVTDLCPAGVESTYSLRITPSTASGSGTLKAFGTSSQTTYTLKNLSSIEGVGTWRGGESSWREVPNNPQLLWRVIGPSIQSTYTLPALAYNATLSAGRVELKTRENRPDGKPWASGQIGVPAVTVGSGGLLNLPLPQLPIPMAESPKVYKAYCDATCGEIRNLGLNLGTAVPSGTGISGLGTLKFVNEWQSQCEVWAVNPRNGRTEGNGKCKATTTCPPGQNYFQGNDQKWYCRVPAVQPPQIPTPPRSISVRVEACVR